MHGEFDVLPGEFPEGHFLWDELSDKAIHVLVGAAFPRGIGMGDVEVGPEFAGDSGSGFRAEMMAGFGLERLAVFIRIRKIGWGMPHRIVNGRFAPAHRYGRPPHPSPDPLGKPAGS